MTFYFYDLETSGLSSTAQRIMQFGGIRTDENLNIIDEPFECYVKLTDEVLPDPTAIMVTGISPQKTLEEGYSEPEFIKLLEQKVFKPDTVIVGYNNVRFDDEFIRNLMWRNLKDPYEWHWKERRSRWDIIDITRMTRALRPDGIEWAFDDDGRPTNRLDQLSVANKIKHSNAHTALADVEALIQFAKILKDKQPKLFNYLLSNRDKKSVGSLVNIADKQPFIHSSGKIPSENLSTSVFYPLFKDPNNPQSVISFDLRYDCSDLIKLSKTELAQRLYMSRAESEEKKIDRLPIKGIHINKSPAVAPLGVLDKDSESRIRLSLEDVKKNLKSLESNQDFIKRLSLVFSEYENSFEKSEDVDQQMYDSFVGDKDRGGLVLFNRSLDFDKFGGSFVDPRLNELLARYKARHYKDKLSEDEIVKWQTYRQNRLQDGIVGSLGIEKFGEEISRLKAENKSNKNKLFLLEELELYLQSIV